MESLRDVVFTLLFKRKHKKTNKMVTKLDGSEVSMIPLIEKYQSDFLPGVADTFFLNEFTVGRGIADAYIVSRDLSALKRRKNLVIPAIVDKVEGEIVRYLNEHPSAHIQQLETHMRKRGVRNTISTLERLIDEQVVLADNHKLILANYSFTDFINFSVAIEAKVSDWRRGIKQALRYKNFSDKSYLVVYDKYIKPARDHIGVFEAMNIGLVGLTDEGINIYFDPAINSKDVSKCFLASERVYSIIDGAQDSFVARNNFATNSTIA